MKNHGTTESYSLISEAVKGNLTGKEFEMFNNLCKHIPLYNFYAFAMAITDLMSDKAIHLLIEGIIKEVELFEHFPFRSNERLKVLMSEEAKRYNYKVEYDEQNSVFLAPLIPKAVPDAILVHFKTILENDYNKIKNSSDDGSALNYVISSVASVLNGLYLEHNEKFSKGFGNLILQIAARDAQVKYKLKLQRNSKQIMSKLSLDNEGKIIPTKKKLKLVLNDIPKFSEEIIEEKVNHIIEKFFAKRIDSTHQKSSFIMLHYIHKSFNRITNKLKNAKSLFKHKPS